MQGPETHHWNAWLLAAQNDAIDSAVRRLYADLDQAVVDRAPLCNASGRCCKFDTYGHRLYVTGLEIAWFLSKLDDNPSTRQSSVSKQPADQRTLSLQQIVAATSDSPDACIYQIDGLCSTHHIRPLGCRVFFCEEGTEAWQQDTTEFFLSRLKALHAQHDLPYVYMEWRSGLREAQAAVAD